MQKLIGIQYLRGIGAIFVVIYHSPGRFGFDIHIGAAGVDLFFVISGFIMVFITDERSRFRKFTSDRFFRVSPLYWIVTLVMLTAAYAGLFPNMVITSWHVVSSLLYIPSVSPSNGQIWPILVPGWTLNIEVFFYICFGTLLFLKNQFNQIAILTLIFIALVSIGYFLQPTSAAGQFYTDPIILEFLAGGWLGLAWKTYPRFHKIFGYPAIAAAIIWLMAAFFSDVSEPRVLIYGIPGFLLVVGVLTMEKHGEIGRFRIPAILGNASYSIYLWHTLAIPVAFRLSIHLQMPAVLGIVLCIVAGVLSGVLGYYFIEIPMTKLISQRQNPGKAPEQAVP